MDDASRKDLYDTNIRLVAWIARKYTTDEDLLDDLKVVGEVALWEATGKYDPSRGHRFTTYAVHCIYGAIRKELRNNAPEWYNNNALRKPNIPRPKVEELNNRIYEPGCVDDIVDLVELIHAMPLRAKGRMALIMHEVDGYTYAEIGKMFGIHGNVAGLYARQAKAALRECREMQDYVREEEK